MKFFIYFWIFQGHSKTYIPVTLISGGNFKPSHTRGAMSRNDGGMEIIYIFLDDAIRRCSELRPDLFEGQSGRSDWIRAAFERQSKDSDDIWIAFQLNSCNIEIDSGSNRNALEVHSGSFEAHSGHSGRVWSGLPFRSILLRRRSECFERCWNAVTACKHIFEEFLSKRG